MLRSPLRLVACVLLTTLLAACPGRLENPEQFVGGGGPGGPVTTCTLGTGAVLTQIVVPRCATSDCHDRGGRAGGLDLESPGVSSRLVGVRSSCMGQLLVTPNSGGAGYFIDKLGASPRCGRRMPLASTPLTASEVSCVREWLATLGVDAGTMDVPSDMVRPDVSVPDVIDARADVFDARADLFDASDAADGGGDREPVDAADVGAPLDAADASDVGSDVADARAADAADARVDARADVTDARADIVDAADAGDDVADASDDIE